MDMYALPVAGRRPPSRARAWAVVQHSEMNCVRDTRADTVRRFYWEGARGQRAAGRGGKEVCSAMGLAASGFVVNRASFRVVIADWSITYQEVELLDYIRMICLSFFF